MYLYVEIHQERLSGDDGKVSLVLKGNLTTTTTLLKTPKYTLKVTHVKLELFLQDINK